MLGTARIVIVGGVGGYEYAGQGVHGNHGGYGGRGGNSGTGRWWTQ